MAFYLSYWKPSTVKFILRHVEETGDEKMTHSASNQYERVQPGDTVWIATVIKGGLAILGRIVVDTCTSQLEAERLLGTDDLWPALWHIIARRGTEVPVRLVDASDLASDLVFLSSRARLTVGNGRVNAQQLQSLRHLAPKTAALLERRWKRDLKLAEDAKGRMEHGGSGFGDADTNRRIETVAIAAVTRHYEGRGWEVESVESQRVGYDLRCKRGRAIHRVEVKGTQSLIPSFIITEGERAASVRESAWILCVVTNALTRAPKLNWTLGKDLASVFVIQPLVYRAVLSPNRKQS